jgi:hypothetical protein
MRRILPTVLWLTIGSAAALGQTAGGGGATAGGGAARSSGGATTAAPGIAAPGVTAAPGSVNAPGLSPPAPGVANTPVDPQRNNVDANPPSQRLPGTTANAPNGSIQPGVPLPNGAVTTTPGSGRPDPGGANSSPGTGSAAAGKDAAKSAVADCMGLWDKGTHMTKAEWLATCKRIQGRLDNLKVDPVAVSPPPKRQRSARSREE